ncbi:MAG: hypothetical protein HS101_14150 [Planctomycetia bacterium]|jgi:type II secretory pathway pseudopilin PulG|nr:hypothetical protein [Planctomycetia bacterium]MCC7314630.1 hypothetical protein [Planctomycetota bacterium]OQY98735.1 MAG: hypothetical protein B6D36_17205 [Planctomycetes bacterium UTPLA1]
MTTLSRQSEVIRRSGVAPTGDNPRAMRRRPGGSRSAFSLLETTIALSILGVGLIMVAAVFPVALTEHRQSTEQFRAMELFSKAEAMIAAKVNTADLWVDPVYLPGGLLVGRDSPWYLLPTSNVALGNDCWDAMIQGLAPDDELYANLANGYLPGVTVTPPFPNRLTLLGLDILSDKLAPFTNLRNSSPCMAMGSGVLPPSASPFTDAELMTTPNRIVWYGFYRRLAAGTFEFAAAACKQRRRQFFAEQDLTIPAFASDLGAFRTDRRLPVPWRVLVAWDGRNVISNGVVVVPPPPHAVELKKLARLAPIGTKLMVRGGVDGPSPVPPISAGTILTVSDIIDDYSVEIVGETSGLVPYDPDFPTSPGPPFYAFDVWVFPPAFESGFLGRESPVLDWRVPL